MNKFDYACLMLKANVPNWDTILSRINPDDVYRVGDYGLEVEPHITILYGFENSVSIKDIKDGIYKWVKNPITFKIEGISVFENPSFDVIKFDVKSDSLQQLHKLFTQFPHIKTYPDYKPHITVSYLKKGTFKNYNFKLSSPKIMRSNTFVFSTSDKKRYEWANDKRLANDAERMMKTGPWSI